MMDVYLEKMAEILDEERVSPDAVLADFSSWDSLAMLSAAMLATELFGRTVDGQTIRAATTVEDLFHRLKADK